MKYPCHSQLLSQATFVDGGSNLVEYTDTSDFGGPCISHNDYREGNVAITSAHIYPLQVRDHVLDSSPHEVATVESHRQSRGALALGHSLILDETHRNI